MEEDINAEEALRKVRLLSPWEMTVFIDICNGKSLDAIAQQRNTKPRVLEFLLGTLYDKTGLTHLADTDRRREIILLSVVLEAALEAGAVAFPTRADLQQPPSPEMPSQRALAAVRNDEKDGWPRAPIDLDAVRRKREQARSGGTASGSSDQRQKGGFSSQQGHTGSHEQPGSNTSGGNRSSSPPPPPSSPPPTPPPVAASGHRFPTVPVLSGVCGALIVLTLVLVFSRHGGSNPSPVAASTSTTTTVVQAPTPTSMVAPSSTSAAALISRAPSLSGVSGATQISGAGVPTPPPAPTAAPTPTPVARTSSVLYQANWKAGSNGWLLTHDWKVLDGMLIDDGTSYTDPTWRPWAQAPFTPASPDYTVEIEAQIVQFPTEQGSPYGCGSFGIMVRSAFEGGVYPCGNDSEIEIWSKDHKHVGSYVPLDANKAWHTYRLEVHGNSFQFFVDGALYLSASDNRYIDPGTVGIWCDRMQVNVRAFRVLPD